MTRANVAALEVFGRHRVNTMAGAGTALTGCDHLLLSWRGSAPPPPTPEGWALLAHLRRPTERSEQVLVLRRQP